MGPWKLFTCSVHSECVCTYSGCLWYVIGGTPDKRGSLKVVLQGNWPTQWFRPLTQWLCVPTQWLCVLSYRGTPDKHGALERCFPVGFYRRIDPQSGFVCSQSGCVCPHSGYVCCIIGGTPYKHGALESCFLGITMVRATPCLFLTYFRCFWDIYTWNTNSSME